MHAKLGYSKTFPTVEDWQRSIVTLLAGAMPVGGSRDYVTPDLAQGIPAGDHSPPLPVRFRRNGIVIGMKGSELHGDAAVSAIVDVRVQVAGQEELFTTGQGAASLSLTHLFGLSGPNYNPLFRRIYSGQVWNVIFTNRSDDSELFIFPTLSFTVLEDPEA